MNVLLVTLDTVRCSHFGCYGYQYPTTPCIDEFSEKCLIGENALTTSPITMVAHASILTSLYPFQHGIHDNGCDVLGDNTPVLAEILKEQGYNTSAFVGSFVLDKRFGLDKGFDLYDDKMTKKLMSKWRGHEVGEWERCAGDVTENAIDWLKNHLCESFFMWVHYFDCHMPYSPPPEFKGVVKSDTEDYDNELRYVDSEVGKLLGFMEENKLLDNTLIVIVGDHGEAFGEKGERCHGMELYDTTLKVPFLVYHPSKTRRKIGYRISVLDVAPTILTQLELPVPEHMCGKDVYRVGDDCVERDFHAETYMRSRGVKGDYAESIYHQSLNYIKYSLLGWFDPEQKLLCIHGESPFDLFLEELKKKHKKHMYNTKRDDADKEIVEERLRSLGYL